MAVPGCAWLAFISPGRLAIGVRGGRRAHRVARSLRRPAARRYERRLPGIFMLRVAGRRAPDNRGAWPWPAEGAR